MKKEKTGKAAPKTKEGERKPNYDSMRYEKLRAEYIASGDLTKAGKEAGYSDKYVRSRYREIRDRLEADPVVLEARQEIKETGIASATEKRQLLWNVAQAAATAVPVTDHEGNETGEYKFDARGAVEAIRELNRMDGDHAEIQIKHKGKVGMGHSFDPESMSDEDIESGLAEFAELIRKGEAGSAAEGEEEAG